MELNKEELLLVLDILRDGLEAQEDYISKMEDMCKEETNPSLLEEHHKYLEIGKIEFEQIKELIKKIEGGI